MWNEAVIIGYVGRDPEVRTTQNGDKCANLSIATTERWKDRSGESKEKTEWHRVVVWGNLADVVDQYVHKGSLLAVRGKIQTRKWTDQSDNDRYSTEIVLSGFDAKLQMLGGKGGGGEAPAEQTSRRSSSKGTMRGGGIRGSHEAPQEDLDDEIPF